MSGRHMGVDWHSVTRPSKKKVTSDKIWEKYLAGTTKKEEDDYRSQPLDVVEMEHNPRWPTDLNEQITLRPAAQRQENGVQNEHLL